LNLALAVITVGTGLLKPNASSLLSILYPHKDSRKEAGYTLYYVGIYAGAISGSLLGGYLQKTFGWSIAFYSASLGGIISVLTFAFGICKFKLVDKRKAHPTAKDYLATLVSIVALIITSYFVLHSEFLSLIYFIIIAMFILFIILYS
jgi:POT family proton-dependent oligopeptide transporter